MHAIERILAPLGRRVDEASPLCDARLADGSRVNVVIPPLSLSRAVPDDPALPARRASRCADLVANGTLPAALAELLALCVAARGVGAGERRHRVGEDDDARTRCRARSPARSGS